MLFSRLKLDDIIGGCIQFCSKFCGKKMIMFEGWGNVFYKHNKIIRLGCIIQLVFCVAFYILPPLLCVCCVYEYLHRYLMEFCDFDCEAAIHGIYNWFDRSQTHLTQRS